MGLDLKIPRSRMPKVFFRIDSLDRWAVTIESALRLMVTCSRNATRPTTIFISTSLVQPAPAGSHYIRVQCMMRNETLIPTCTVTVLMAMDEVTRSLILGQIVSSHVNA